MKRLQGKVALITGGARGLGTAHAILLAEHGAAVVVADVHAQEAEQVAAQIRAAGGQAIAAQLDIASDASWAAAIELTLKTFGGFHVLVNNAGIDLRGSVEDVNAEQFLRVVDVNLLGSFHGMKRAVAHMKDHGGGSIVNVASTTAMIGASVTTAYGATKAGVVNLTKTVALHCAQAGYGIRVNAVLPGPVATRMVLGTPEEPTPPEVVNWIKSVIPLGRLAEPREIAHAVLFLASDESSFMTGSSMVVDGGQTAQ